VSTPTQPPANRLIALQFLAVVLPILLVLIGQTIADAYRAAALDRSRPLRVFAQEARADYKAFLFGVGDAVDSGTLGSAAVDALKSSLHHMQELASAGADSTVLRDAVPSLASLAGSLEKSGDLPTLMKLRDPVRAADALTKSIADEFDARDAAVMQQAIQSAKLQRIAVIIATILTGALTVFFVIRSQRRLQARLAADRRIAEESLRIRNALDNCSTGIMVVDPAGTVAYANRSLTEHLRVAVPDVAASTAANSIEGLPLQRFAGSHEGELRAGGRVDASLGSRTFRVTSDLVRTQDGRAVGCVLEWNDRTEQAALEREVAAIVDAASRGEFDRRIALPEQTGGQNAFYAALIGGINRLMQTSEASLKDVSQMLEALADGDLTHRISADYRGTFAKLKDFSNRTADRLQEIVGQIKASAEEIDTAAGAIADGNTELKGRTDQQAQGVQSTARSMAEITGVVRGAGERAHEADRLASDASKVARDGGQVVSSIIRTMSDIAGSSRKIADIIGVIDSLAFQTNILALNAAVEAARAGDHGRGFAVVAAEVRTLAARSAEAAREIRALIGASVQTVDSGAKLVDSAGHSMEAIVTAIDRVSGIVRAIAEASASQTSGVEQIDLAIAQIDEATRMNATLVEDAATSASSLKQQAAFLVDSVAVFRLDSAMDTAASPPGSVPAATGAGRLAAAGPR